jgi:hypothetical protein
VTVRMEENGKIWRRAQRVDLSSPYALILVSNHEEPP